jgi:hypothetical protein
MLDNPENDVIADLEFQQPPSSSLSLTHPTTNTHTATMKAYWYDNIEVSLCSPPSISHL